MRKHRIAFLLPGVGIVNRGTESFVLELTTRLCQAFDVTILSRGKVNDLCQQISGISRDMPILTKPYQNRIGRKLLDKLFLDPSGVESLSFSLNALPHLWREKYDLLMPLNGIWGALVSRSIRQMRGTPFITRGGAGIGRPDLWQIRQKPDIHIVLTEHARQWVLKQCPGLSVQKIPNGVDIHRYHPDVQPAQIPLERPVYLCVAAHMPYKNIRLTIEAVSRLKEGSLVVLGTGPLKAELRRQGLNRLGPQRFMLKAVPYPEMPHYFAACDVFTLVSEKDCEAFGIVYLEAMACNKPVVATDDPIRTEIVGNAGILCDGYDVDEYATALREAAAVDLASKPRQQAERFDWELIAAQYQQVIQKSLK